MHNSPSFHSEQSGQLVYKTSRWQDYLYKTRQTAVADTERGMVTPLREDDALAKADYSEVADFAASMGREVFSRLYGDPKRLDGSSAPRWMDRFHETLDTLPEWDVLRSRVQSDPDFSMLAANAMLGEITPRLAEIIKAVSEDEDQSPEDGEGMPGAGTGAGASMLRQVLRAACGEASGEVEEVKDAIGGLAPGLESRPDNHMQTDARRMDLLTAMGQRRDLERVAQMAGRLRRIAARTAREIKDRTGFDDIVGIEQGSEIARLLGSEQAALADDLLGDLAMLRILEQKALQYSIEARQSVGRGPIIFIRDTSGSMGGDPHLWGAAVGIALASQAHKEGRVMMSCNFTTTTKDARRLDSDGLWTYDGDDLVKSASKGPMALAEASLAHASDNCGGGTRFGPAMAWALAAGVEQPKADFVFLTDGAARIAPDVLDRLRTAKDSGLRVFGLTINGGSTSPAVQAICDEVIDLDSMPDEETTATGVGRMLGRARA